MSPFDMLFKGQGVRLLEGSPKASPSPRAMRTELDVLVAQRTATLLSRNAELEARARELELAYGRILALSQTDHLTGVPNRRFMDDALRRELARCQRSGAPLAVLFVDLDHFKRVNDQLGHDVGDSVLAAVANELQVALRPYDVLARWGGEEFLVLLPESDAGQARRIAERLRERLAELVIPGCPWSVTGSIGIAARRPDDSPSSLVHRADEALYRAKAAGRNRVEGERRRSSR